jgi:ectoine hydroxylase-related dioxygenase (phytanoyl-CoA dioxygenase family)
MTTGNNALKGTGGLRQPVHKDTRFRHPKCPFLVIANTAIVDFTLENGATEFWLGTHAFSDESCQTKATEESINHDESVKKEQRAGNPACPVLPEAVEARRLIRPPIRAIMKKGDVMLRDFRTWHAGMPNNTDEDRIMIAQAWAVSQVLL